ncbi:MAG: hypothetical protein MR209_00215 [Veillonellaceae bacterium]|nr:hypothetical protein [Veillonellaceae bacterium]
MDTIRFTLRLSDKVDSAIAKIAKAEGKSKNTVIVDACQALIDRHKRATRRLKE